jgi:hypothetical protein
LVYVCVWILGFPCRCGFFLICKSKAQKQASPSHLADVWNSVKHTVHNYPLVN